MSPRRWIILAVLFAARAATGFQFQSIGSTANMLMRDLGINYSGIGILLGAYLLPGIVVALPAGLLGRRFRDRNLGLAGLAMVAVSGVALGCSEGFVEALVARTIGGVGATVVVLVATKMTAGLVRQPRDRARDVAAADELAVRRDARSADPGLCRPAFRMARGDVVRRLLRRRRAMRLHPCSRTCAGGAAGGDGPFPAPRWPSCFP